MASQTPVVQFILRIKHQEDQIKPDSAQIRNLQLKSNTCNGAYVGQSGRAINIRYKEHIRYRWANNPKSAYATHILDNRHEYGTEENTLQLLQAFQKGTRMDCWETLYIQALHQRKVLITEQQVNDTIPLFELAIITHTDSNHNLSTYHQA
jgi:hypothetical protein